MSIALIIAAAAFGIGWLLMMIGGIWSLVLAFQESLAWGLASFFIPFAALVFIFMKWSKRSVRRSFFLSLIGLAFALIGGIVAAPTLSTISESTTGIESSTPESNVQMRPDSNTMTTTEPAASPQQK
jgi:hypothetical protein